jgi:hypothetical protein
MKRLIITFLVFAMWLVLTPAIPYALGALLVMDWQWWLIVTPGGGRLAFMLFVAVLYVPGFIIACIISDGISE